MEKLEIGSGSDKNLGAFFVRLQSFILPLGVSFQLEILCKTFVYSEDFRFELKKTREKHCCLVEVKGNWIRILVGREGRPICHN